MSHSIQPETIYRAESSSGETIMYLFTPKVIKELFESSSELDQRAATRILKAIKNGMLGGPNIGNSGVKPLRGIRDVYEVRIHGASLPHRIYGYLHHSVFHFVFFSRENNHSSDRSIARAVNNVRSQRNTRGH